MNIGMSSKILLRVSKEAIVLISSQREPKGTLTTMVPSVRRTSSGAYKVKDNKSPHNISDKIIMKYAMEASVAY